MEYKHEMQELFCDIAVFGAGPSGIVYRKSD